jgi:hypothetical protein
LTFDHIAYPFAHVRLRDLDSGLIVEETSSNHEGEFSFLLKNGGTLVSEVTEEPSGEVLGVGDLLVLKAGEAAGTVVLLPSDFVPSSTLFNGSAAETIAAAANVGIGGTAPGDSLSGEK